MKKILLALTMMLSAFTYAQSDDTEHHPFRIELEPSGFIYRGYGVQALYDLNYIGTMTGGLYFSSLDVPDWTHKGMFDEVSDTADVRLGFEAALVYRYRFLIGNGASAPYVGAIAGYEYFDITQAPYPKTVRLSTFVVTPYIGYEVYVWNQRLYVNPQVRSVFYINQQSSDNDRPETLSNLFILPTISLGYTL
ncbi:MAG TPA: hypothetical protein PKO19_14510 [Chitinophagales bacterium]|nr:hypothetical protein [Chitinophagales bacterium]HMZ90653.1 hypothetical protein [Chitinophagales bacterium]HNE44814.1 hypothetical protein [Chitinophagales bacterium]HNJ90741.1 hypothetical protein [Chitinophagales bacterium]HNK99322.1 hypothetical protein [Chitinophagales bacterium]